MDERELARLNAITWRKSLGDEIRSTLKFVQQHSHDKLGIGEEAHSKVRGHLMAAIWELGESL